MRKKLYSQLWIYFACIIFLMMLLVLTVFIILLLLINHYEFLSEERSNHLFPLGFISFLSLVIGAGVSLFVGKRILQPIANLRKAMTEVSQGDFSIVLDDQQKVHEVAQLYHDFNLMVRGLNSIEMLQNNFVSDVSHEFKTPIATIQGYVQLLQADDLSQTERQDYLRRIQDGTQQLSQLTENILKLTKLENQELGLEKQHFRLDEQLRQVILFLQPRWENQGIDWQLDLVNTDYFGNEELLYQVWLNLIDNALKYSPKNTTITISLKVLPDTVIVTISDQGIGMAEKTIPKIFDKFYQSDTSRKSKGNGLGLALVQKIIALHQGEIKVTSKLAVGTTFKIYLPLHTKKS